MKSRGQRALGWAVWSLLERFEQKPSNIHLAKRWRKKSYRKHHFIGLTRFPWFHVPLLGSLPALALGLFLFLLSSIGVELMISSLAVTQQQGLLGAFLFFVPAIILSGFSTPIANMPEYLQLITYLNPLRYFLVIVRSVFLEGATLNLLWAQFWPMALIGCFTLFMAGTLFRHRMA